MKTKAREVEDDCEVADTCTCHPEHIEIGRYDTGCPAHAPSTHHGAGT